MPRVKRGTIANKKREKLLKQTKGFKWGRKNKERAAKEALIHAYSHAFRGRKEKKRTTRSLWNVRINAASRLGEAPIRYNELMNGLKTKEVVLNRKMLADLAKDNPEVFAKIIEFVRA